MGHLVKLFLVICVTSAINAQCNNWNANKFFSRSLHEFNIKLSLRISQDTEGHFVASPLSVWSLVSTLWLGASGITQNEIKQVLRLHNHKCFNTKSYELIQQVTSSNSEVEIERSSVVIVDKYLPLNAYFEKAINKTGISKVLSVFLSDTVDAAEMINDYVTEATHGRVEDIVQSNDLDSVLMVLIDALYFRGYWNVTFDERATEESIFHDNYGQAAGYVNMMKKSGSYHNTRLDLISSEILALPYGNESKYSMLIFLPYLGTTAEQVLENLLKTSMSEIVREVVSSRESLVSIQLPRFQMSSDLTLEDFLIDMGLRSMFDSSFASFDKISKRQLHVSSLLQKAYVEVTEKGTTAAAATVAEMTGRSMIQRGQFNMNRPFVYMIVDTTKEMALFTGIYAKPTIY